MAQQRDHGVGKVLAHAFAAKYRLINGRVYPRGARLVVEVVKQLLIQLLHEHERIVPPRHAHLLCKLSQCRRFHGEGAGQQHLPVVALLDHLVERAPCVRRKKRRHLRQNLRFHHRLPHDH